MDKKQREYLSFHDSLTDLYNKRYLNTHINRLVNSRKLPVSVIVISLDKLKELNNSFGHSFGDQYIIKAAEILKDIFRGEDIVARIAGNEFAVLLPETDETDVKKISKRIKDNFQNADRKDDFPLNFDISIGTSMMNAQDNELVSYYSNREIDFKS